MSNGGLQLSLTAVTTLISPQADKEALNVRHLHHQTGDRDGRVAVFRAYRCEARAVNASTGRADRTVSRTSNGVTHGER